MYIKLKIMAKKKKDSKEYKSKVLEPVDVDASIKKLDALEEGSVVTIPPNVIINVPISGMFRYAIEDTLHYIMSSMTSDEIIVSMHKVRKGFKDEKGSTSPRDTALWTLMSLLAEINYQAADQNLTVLGDNTVKEDMAGIINSMNKGDVESAKNMAEYSSKMKEFNKKMNSNEDSN